MSASKTNRGFDLVQFKDANGKDCSLQCSSAIGDHDDSFDRPGSSFVWLGVDNPIPKLLAKNEGWKPMSLPEGVLLNGRMHLNREQVGQLVVRLQRWLHVGSVLLPSED